MTRKGGKRGGKKGFGFCWYDDQRDLQRRRHSFPTRRSSDLLNAQVGKKFTFGPKAAGTITSVTNLNKAIGDDDGGSNAKAGFQIGGFVEYKPSKLIGLSAEVLYSEQGAENKITIIGGSSTTYKNTTKLNYLDIPILFKIYPVDRKSVV